MKPLDLLHAAGIEIRAHAVRSALTCVSLSIGIAAALYTISQLASTHKRYVDARMLAGPGRLEIWRKQNPNSKGLSKGLTVGDTVALRELFPGLYMVSPITEWATPSFSADGFQVKTVYAIGVTSEWRKRDWVYRLRGRFLSPRDEAEAARVCVITIPGGWIKRPYWAKETYVDPYETYVKNHDLLGKWISLNERPFRVVGVLQSPPRDKDPRWFHWGYASAIYMPISTYERVLRTNGDPQAGRVNPIVVDTGDEATASFYARRIENALSVRHRGENDFEVKDYRVMMEGALKNIKNFMRSVAVIGIVAILAGGIGILNVTLATVFSRVREIGVRRALGATRGDIVAQFVIEALVLGALAGVIGTALGTGAVIYLSPSEAMADAFSPLHALASTALAVATSFVFSVAPAWQASKMDPVESLRYE